MKNGYKTCLIFVCGSSKQNKYLWPSYNNCVSGYNHDLIVVHRDYAHLPEQLPACTLENKIFPEGELPNKAFGAYRYYFNKYKNDYDIFGFVSDDVVFKRDNWLQFILSKFEISEKIGFVGTQIFNGSSNQYPHPSHVRAPIWFARTNALSEITWEFNDDHDGEMRIADQFVEAGYFGIQAGNKINVAYDSCENGGHYEGDHISAIFEKQVLNHDLNNKFTEDEINKMDEINYGTILNSPFPHIGNKTLMDIEPYDNLVYDKSVSIAQKYCGIVKLNKASIVNEKINN